MNLYNKLLSYIKMDKKNEKKETSCFLRIIKS